MRASASYGDASPGRLTFSGSKGFVGLVVKVSLRGGKTMGKTSPTVPIIRLHMTTGSWCMASVNHLPSLELMVPLFLCEKPPPAYFALLLEKKSGSEPA